MAVRPVFTAISEAPYFKQVNVEFPWHGALNATQKRRNVAEIHKAFAAQCPGMRILEASSKSTVPLGVSLSAFYLRKYVPSLDQQLTVENVYQAGKCFSGGGPYQDLLTVTPKEAKLDRRLQSSGALTGFFFEGESYPLRPTNAFYDWLYISALQENPEVAAQILEYDAFTDIEFNPKVSLNCQARTAAVFVGMTRAGVLSGPVTFAQLCAL
ncbi:MAG: hypothetical protein E7447_03370 [Ruminococcaceae bacterium]|nr:hypothetical protein [Oscillospiraceae bacterium]